ncbi:MAG: FAD-binding oxidoreductase, partial [Roseovarius sp.]|nr:FAD-binding oxidoreductase [Roseovarius sp.]
MTTLRVKDLPDLPGRAAWNAILGPAPAHAPLTGTRTADVVIVGAGFAGLSAARRLRQIDPRASVVVLEAGRVAEGSAGRNSGFMIDLPHELTSEDYAGAGDDRAMIALNRQAIAFAAEAVDDYRIGPNFFDRAGKINGAASDTAHAHNQSYAAHLASLGEPSEMLDARAMRHLTGSAHYRSGLYTPGTVMLQPAGYIRGLAAGLSHDGVTI